MKTMRMAGVLLASLIGLRLLGCQKRTPSITSEVVPAREVWLSAEQTATLAVANPATENVEEIVSTGGKVAFDEARVAHVFSAATGRVERIAVDLGTHVKRGDTLAVLQSADIGAATSDLAKAEADVIAADRDYARKKDLFEQHAASRADLDTSEDAQRRAHAEKQRTVQHAQLFQVAPDAVVSSGFVVRSPIAGEVIARAVSPGVEVQGQYNGGTAIELFTIGDIDSVWVVADIFEVDFPKVRLGDPVRVRSIAYPGRTFEGKVDWVASSLDPVTRASRIRCRFANPAHDLVPEMAVTVDVVSGVAEALVVPAEAVAQIGNEHLVFVERGSAPQERNRFEAVRVESEALPKGRTRILSGLKPTDRIVTAHAILLTGGM